MRLALSGVAFLLGVISATVPLGACLDCPLSFDDGQYHISEHEGFVFDTVPHREVHVVVEGQFITFEYFNPANDSEWRVVYEWTAD